MALGRRLDQVTHLVIGLEAAFPGGAPVFGLIRIPAARVETNVAADRAGITHVF